MKEENRFDIIAIGAGSGGLNIAGFMNRVGFKVLLIDKTDENIGGDCLNWGCVPSKALIHIAKAMKYGKAVEPFGVKITGDIDMANVRDYISAKKEVIREHENASYFTKKGMTVKLGKATFTGPNTVSVNGEEFYGKKIVLATGSRPRELNIPGVDKQKIWTNEEIFENDKLPKHLVVIGAGPIGLELAQAYRYLGAKVTIIQRTNQIAGKEDRDLAKLLQSQMEADGIEFKLECEPVEFPKENTLTVKMTDGSKKDVEFDMILTSIGRVLNHEGLDLEKAGIEKTEDGRKIKVDDYLRTTNKNVLLCGDIAGQHQFTHAAEVHAGVILNNFFSPFKKKLNTDHMAWVTYTYPEIGTFGLSESQLKERGIAYTVYEDDFQDDDRAIVDDVQNSYVKMFISPKGKLLGGTMIASHAGELIHELILANTSKLHVKDLFYKVYPYPTQGRINKKVISQFMAGKLSEFSKNVLKLMY